MCIFVFCWIYFILVYVIFMGYVKGNFIIIFNNIYLLYVCEGNIKIFIYLRIIIFLEGFVWEKLIFYKFLYFLYMYVINFILYWIIYDYKYMLINNSCLIIMFW